MKLKTFKNDTLKDNVNRLCKLTPIARKASDFQNYIDFYFLKTATQFVASRNRQKTMIDIISIIERNHTLPEVKTLLADVLPTLH